MTPHYQYLRPPFPLRITRNQEDVHINLAPGTPTSPLLQLTDWYLGSSVHIADLYIACFFQTGIHLFSADHERQRLTRFKIHDSTLGFEIVGSRIPEVLGTLHQNSPVPMRRRLPYPLAVKLDDQPLQIERRGINPFLKEYFPLGDLTVHDLARASFLETGIALWTGEHDEIGWLTFSVLGHKLSVFYDEDVPLT